MKRIASSLALIFITSLILTSCKYDDYECVCSYTENGQVMTHTKEYKEVRKKDAQEDCEILNVTYKSCELK